MPNGTWTRSAAYGWKCIGATQPITHSNTATACVCACVHRSLEQECRACATSSSTRSPWSQLQPSSTSTAASRRAQASKLPMVACQSSLLATSFSCPPVRSMFVLFGCQGRRCASNIKSAKSSDSAGITFAHCLSQPAVIALVGCVPCLLRSPNPWP